MGLILDSTVVVAAERLGHTPQRMLEAIRERHGNQQSALSVVTVLELAHGLVRADTSERRAKRQRFLDDLLTGMPIHPVSVAIALRAGRLDGEMKAAGTRIPLADLLIGSTALELGYEVATGNFRQFKLIPGLVVTQL